MAAPAAAAAARGSATRVGAARAGGTGAAMTRSEIDRLPGPVRDQVLAQLGDAVTESGGDDDQKRDTPSRPRSRRRRTRRPLSRTRGAVRSGARRATAPAVSATTTVTTLMVSALGLVLLYAVLRNADALEATLGAVRSGLAWLSDPTRSIPYAPTR